VKDAASVVWITEQMVLEQDHRISEVVKREQSRLRNFIRRRVPDPRDAEDILQDVFYELVEANRLPMPIEHVTGVRVSLRTLGVLQCGLWSRCVKNLFWHSFAADSNPLNSGVPRSFTSIGSDCKV